MNEGNLIRIAGFILIPIIVRLVLFSKRKPPRDWNQANEIITIHAPQVYLWVALCEILFCFAVIFVMVLFPNGTETIFAFTVFFLLALFGLCVFFIAVNWKIEILAGESFFILNDCWGKKHTIRYRDCESYCVRGQGIIVRNHVKKFSVACNLVNFDAMISALNSNGVKLVES